VIFKLVVALTTGGSGYWLWSQANTWIASGVIPAIWDESGKPTKRGEPGFKRFVIWTKILAAFVWLFCAMCLASMIFGWGD
jgi:hypothetical protein